MKPNLRIGLLLSNHHPGVKDDVALEIIISALQGVKDRVPGEVVIAIYTPEESVWLFTAHHGVFEVDRSTEGQWRAVCVSC